MQSGSFPKLQQLSKMAAKSSKPLTLQVVHGQKKFSVNPQLDDSEIGDALCVSHLCEAIYKHTQIPAGSQRLIFKGKSLKDPTEELSKAGLKNNDKIMLIGKKPTPVDDEASRAMEEVEKTFEKQAKRLDDVTYELDGIHRGFLDKNCQMDALQQKDKQLATIAEAMMKMLEKLDSLQFEESNRGGRGKRKSLVDKIQVLLGRIDGLTKGIEERRQNNSGTSS